VGVINISLPISYSIGEFASDILQPSGLDFNVSVSTFPDQKQVASIILASNIEANTTVVIILRGLVNGKYPGAVGGVLDTKYTVESFDGNGFPIDQASAQPGTLLPIVLLNSRVIFDPNKLKTGSYGNLTFKFLVEAAIEEDSEIVISLAKGFIPCTDVSTTLYAQFEMDSSTMDRPMAWCKLTVNQPTSLKSCTFKRFSSTCDEEDEPQDCLPMAVSDVVTLKVNVDQNCTTNKMSSVSLVISDILNPTYYGRTGEFGVRVENDLCGADRICAKSKSIAPVFMGYNDILEVEVLLFHQYTGLLPSAEPYEGIEKISFKVNNPVPPNGFVVVDVPRGFVINNSYLITVTGAATVEQERRGQLIYFSVLDGASRGSKIEFSVTGIRNRNSAGPAWFEIRTTDNMWNFLDRAYKLVSLLDTPLVGSIEPVSRRTLISGNDGQRVPVVVSEDAVRLGVFTNYSISFTTLNVVDRGGSINVSFPVLFKVDYVQVVDVTGVTFVQGSNEGPVLTVSKSSLSPSLRFYVTESIQVGTLVEFTVTSVVNAHAAGGPSGGITVRTETPLGGSIDKKIQTFTYAPGILQDLSIDFVAHAGIFE